MSDERIESLIQRVADGVSTTDELAELARHARAEPSLWQRCADEMTARRLTIEAARAASATASRVTLPTASRVSIPGGAWGGWAAALLVTFAWLAMSSLSAPIAAPAPVVAPVMTIDDHSPSELFLAYVERGRDDGSVIEVLPSLPVDMRATKDGDAVVFRYMRRIIEEATVDGTVRMATDEAGRSRLVPKPMRAGTREAM